MKRTLHTGVNGSEVKTIQPIWQNVIASTGRQINLKNKNMKRLYDRVGNFIKIGLNILCYYWLLMKKICFSRNF